MLTPSSVIYDVRQYCHFLKVLELREGGKRCYLWCVKLMPFLEDLEPGEGGRRCYFFLVWMPNSSSSSCVSDFCSIFLLPCLGNKFRGMLFPFVQFEKKNDVSLSTLRFKKNGENLCSSFRHSPSVLFPP
jgi:hypothetical protein